MTAIKICGITRREDAEAAVALGVHALGFVLWAGSPRKVELADVGRIVAGLPPLVTPVGVFVNPSAHEIARAALEGGIRVAQIHGEVPEWTDSHPRLTVLRAVRLGAGDEANIDPPIPAPTPVLLDAHDPLLHGGTGQTVDWERAAAVARTRPVILAGGLTAANVGRALQMVRPYAVDVASGVEESPGVKSHLRMRRFVEAVHRVTFAGRSDETLEEIL
jgi:phosphoribosylanthranilate isomerase